MSSGQGIIGLVLKPGPDPAMNLNFRAAADASESAMRDTVEKAVRSSRTDEVALQVLVQRSRQATS